jgi:hypothetical protein
MSKNKKSDLPLNTLSEIPTSNVDARSITALRKEKGLVIGYQLSDGTLLEKTEALNLARQGGIIGVGIATRKGEEYLKSIPDGSESNNLGNLPSVKQE